MQLFCGLEILHKFLTYFAQELKINTKIQRKVKNAYKRVYGDETNSPFTLYQVTIVTFYVGVISVG